MPTGTAVKASTQDLSLGTPVAQGTTEVTSSGALQTMILEGNVSTYSVGAARTGVTSADTPTGGNMTTTGFAGSAGANLNDKGNSLNIAVWCTCDTASRTLQGRIALYDSSNVCIGMTRTIAFNSDPTLRLGNATGDFIAGVELVDANQARKYRVFVDSVSGGTWAINSRAV